MADLAYAVLLIGCFLSRPDGAWTGEVVSGTGVLANAVGGVLALLLIVYLFVALIRPEKF